MIIIGRNFHKLPHFDKAKINFQETNLSKQILDALILMNELYEPL